MSRALAAADRLATLLVGLALIASGLIVAGWATRWPPRWTQQLPDRVSTRQVTQLTQHPWWPWATGIGGVLLALIALAWLIAHRPHRPHGQTAVPGSATTGKLTADLPTVATAAATALHEAPHMQSTHAKVRRDRGATVVDLIATCDPGVDLDLLGAHADQVAADLSSVLGSATPAIRIHLHTTRHTKRRTRVQ